MRSSTRVHLSVACGVAGLICLLGSAGSVESGSHEATGSTTGSIPPQNDPRKVLGVARASCGDCHSSEVATWMRTAHYASTDKLLRFRGNTKKYANALGIRAEELMTTSLCADCHGTKAVVNDRIKVISGVSCESCHGASGGEAGWLNRHQSYHSEGAVTRREETAAHRTERQAACDAAGMIRPSNIAGLARKCLSCHIIADEKLVAAGHKAFSNIEFHSWTAGEIRHNYFLDETRNQSAPSLWCERTGYTATQRSRLKFVAGTLASLEVALRKRADLTDATVIPQIGGFAAAVNGKLGQINAAGGTPETQAAAKLFAPLMGTIFVPSGTDRQTYSKAADQIATLTNQFLEQNDAAQLDALDPIIALTPPHYSQHYKDRSNP